jgi:hypothetical protein
MIVSIQLPLEINNRQLTAQLRQSMIAQREPVSGKARTRLPTITLRAVSIMVIYVIQHFVC